jgi:hypothetical protein
MVNPKLMCDKHLLGEHGELHKFMPSWERRHSILGRQGAIEPQSYVQRHDELAYEMSRRGMNHKSPISLPDFSYLPVDQQVWKVSIVDSHELLINRCSACQKRSHENHLP